MFQGELAIIKKSPSEETLDPRVQDQLESLNACTDEINHLELQLDEANSTFRNTLSECSQRLKQLAKKLGKCIQIARPYYEAEEFARMAKLECEKAAVLYQRACNVHQEAREAISIAEQRFLSKQNDWEFDATWQEMLNRETMKVLNAEAMKIESEQEHQKRAQMFAVAEERVKSLERQLKKDIAKSRSYFEQKNIFQKTLQNLKGRVESLQKAVSAAKNSYANSLHSLEAISEEIHERRKFPTARREPGVGAELETSISSLDLSKLTLSDLGSSDSDSAISEEQAQTLGDGNAIPVLSLPLLEVPVCKSTSSYTMHANVSGKSTQSCTRSSPLKDHRLQSNSLVLNSSYNCGEGSFDLPKISFSNSEDKFEEIDLNCD